MLEWLNDRLKFPGHLTLSKICSITTYIYIATLEIYREEHVKQVKTEVGGYERRGGRGLYCYIRLNKD